MQRELEDQLSEQILFGELTPGSIVVVDVEGEGEDATFTFKSEPGDAAATCPTTPTCRRSRRSTPASSATRARQPASDD